MKTYLAAICKKYTRECVTKIEEIQARSIHDVQDIMISKYPDLENDINSGKLFIDIEE